MYLTILVNLRESDALCLGLDQTACGSASGCEWHSSSNAIKKPGETSWSAFEYCKSTLCHGKSDETSCTNTNGCMWGKAGTDMYGLGDPNSVYSNCNEAVSCATSGCTYQSLGCQLADDYSSVHSDWTVTDGYMLCAIRGSAFLTGPLYINNLPSNTKGFFCIC